MNSLVFKELKEAWWIDYIEGEVDPRVREAMDLLLRFSKRDQEIVENVLKLKKSLKETINPELPTNYEYYANLQDQIMAKLDEETTLPQKKTLAPLRGHQLFRDFYNKIKIRKSL